MKNWYIAKSKPKKENYLINSLSKLGVETYFPIIKKDRSSYHTTEPLFPTYLFCRFDSFSPNWTAIRWAHGLDYFLNTDGIPTPIPNEMVELIQRKVKALNEHQLKPGDRVAIVKGPFAGLEGVFGNRVNATSRCNILLKIVGRLTNVEIDRADMEIRVS